MQLIMGAGKTTVVAPLLALMLASSSTLFVRSAPGDARSVVLSSLRWRRHPHSHRDADSVVPPSLLAFAQAIFRERFSTLIQKPVFTFVFDRSTGAPLILREKNAQRDDDVFALCLLQSPINVWSIN